MENKGVNNNVSPRQVKRDEKKLIQQPKQLTAELQDLNKLTCYRCGETFDEEKKLYDHQTGCLNYVVSCSNPEKRYLTLQSFQFEARSSLKEDFYFFLNCRNHN